MSDYYDHELTSLEDNPGDLSQAYVDVMTGKMTQEEYDAYVASLDV